MPSVPTSGSHHARRMGIRRTSAGQQVPKRRNQFWAIQIRVYTVYNCSFLPRHFLSWTMAKRVISIRSRWGWLSYCRRDFRLSEEADWFIVQGKQSDGIRQKTGEYEWVETQEICRWNEVSCKEKVKQWYFYDTLMRLPGIRTEKSHSSYLIIYQVFKSVFSTKKMRLWDFFQKNYSRKRKLWTF